MDICSYCGDDVPIFEANILKGRNACNKCNDAHKKYELAKAVIANKPNRDKENIQEWAEQLADDWCGFTD